MPPVALVPEGARQASSVVAGPATFDANVVREVQLGRSALERHQPRHMALPELWNRYCT